MFEFPYRRTTIRTPFSRQELVARFAHTVSPEVMRWGWGTPAGWTDETFTGAVFAHGFNIHRVIRGRNSGLPMVYGRFRETPGGTEIELCVTLHPFVWVFAVLTSSFIIVPLVYNFIVPPSQRMATSVFTLIFPVFIYFIITFSYVDEYVRALSFINYTLSEAVTPVYPAISPQNRVSVWLKFGRICFLIFFVGMLGFMCYSGVQEFYQQTSHTRQPIEAEFMRIPLPPNTSVISGNGTTSITCETSSSYQQITAFYDDELVDAGWTLAGEEPLRDWGRDLGGKIRHYRKGHDVIDLQWAGESAQYGWDYALSLSGDDR